MSLFSRLTAALLCSTLLAITGCVGPAGCGHGNSCGPLAFGDSCGGCGDCDGCGELYIDPWINEPPDCCDPCDRCGNHNGQSCGKCRSSFHGWASLWGYRYDNPCESCGDGACGGCDGSLVIDGGMDAGVGDGAVHIVREPTPAKRIVKAAPVDESQQFEPPFQPDRTRRIFRARPSIAAGDTTTKNGF
jgi:hypothetical protein